MLNVTYCELSYIHFPKEIRGPDKLLCESEETNMKDAILKETNKIKGLQLRAAGRASNLFWLGFGEMIPVTRRGEIEEVPEVALHIQCAWRVSTTSKILVASQDFYSPRSDWEEGVQDFDWDVSRSNRFDEQITAFLEVAAEKSVIAEVEVDSLGGLKILMSESYVLEVFPDSSNESEDWEFWRLFNRRKDSPHFVVSGNGVEYI